MTITKEERETITLSNEAEGSAEVYTYNTKLKNRLAEVAEQYPEVYSLKHENPDGGVLYTLPKKYLKVTIRTPMSEADRDRCRENCQNLKPSQYRQTNSMDKE